MEEWYIFAEFGQPVFAEWVYVGLCILWSAVGFAWAVGYAFDEELCVLVPIACQGLRQAYSFPILPEPVAFRLDW